MRMLLVLLAVVLVAGCGVKARIVKLDGTVLEYSRTADQKLSDVEITSDGFTLKIGKQSSEGEAFMQMFKAMQQLMQMQLRMGLVPPSVSKGVKEVVK